MNANKKTIWAIRAGKTGDADALFLQLNRVALGWREMGNVGRLTATRQAFKRQMAAAYPNYKPGAIPVNAGQLFRFVHEVKVGDLIVYPSKLDRSIRIGEITGEYEYAPNVSERYPNLRAVEWRRVVPRGSFEQNAICELNSMMSFFQIKNCADEIHNALAGKLAPVEKDETIAAVA